MTSPERTTTTSPRASATETPRDPSQDGVSQALTFRPRLTKPHRLIQNTRAESKTRDAYGNPVRNPPKGVDVHVSKAMFQTALVVMDRFIKALEAENMEVDVIEDQRGRGTFAILGHDRVAIHIEEKSKRVAHVPTAKELREKEQFSWTRIPKCDDVATGELVLCPGGVIDLTSESAVNQLIQKAVADVIDGLERARKRRESEEAARRNEWERQRRIQEEKERVKKLHQAADALRQYRILTDYIEEVRRFGRIPEDQRREGQTLEEWLSWAEAQAQRIHPLGR